MKVTRQRRFKATRRALKQYVQAGWSSATRLAYASDLRQFRVWGGRIPATPRLVARYLTEHAQTLSHATLTRRIAAINHAHKKRGMPSPGASAEVSATFRGIRRTHREHQRQATPILRKDLQKRARTAPGLRGLRDRALLLVGFAGGFRASELVSLNCEDVEFVSDGLIATLRKSKNDQEGRGRVVAIPYGRRDAWTCAVRTLRMWIRKAAIANGPIFRKVDRNGVVCTNRLSVQVVSLVVKAFAERIGKDARVYSGHSLRAGFVTSAAAAGVPTWKIRQQTGHKSDLMLAHYIRPTNLFTGHALLSVL